MTLNDQYNRQAPNNLRLSKLSSIPSADDLSFAMTLATNNPRNIVELPWKSATSPHQYTIKVTCALSLEEPRWMLHIGAGSEDDAVIWNYDTPDHNLIFNLITAECERGASQAAIVQSSEMDPRTASGGNYGMAPGQQQMQSGQWHPGPQPQMQQQPQQDYMQQGQQMPQPQVQVQQAPFQQPGFQPAPGQQQQQIYASQPGYQTGANPAFNPQPPAIPLAGRPNTTGNDLPINAFGAAAASIGHPPPPVAPGLIAPTPVVPAQAAPFAAQQNSYAQPYVSGGNQQAQPAPYVEEPFVGHQVQSHGQQYQSGGQQAQTGGYQTQSGGYGQHAGQPMPVPQQKPTPSVQDSGVSPPYNQYSQQSQQQQTNSQLGQAYAAPVQQPVLPQETPQLPSSRLFTLPDPANVRNPAERLVDHATTAPQEPPAKTPAPLPPPVRFDRAAVDNVFKMLTEPDLGFLSHGALMFFTVREFSRFQRNNVPFSIVLFELGIPSGNRWEPMPLNLVKDVGKQLFGVMRPLDLIAHYDKDDFAMLLPHTSREDSFTVVQRLHEMLMSTAVAPGMSPGQAQIFCGIATIPDDCAHPGIGIAAALEAKAQAKALGKPVLRFCDI